MAGLALRGLVGAEWYSPPSPLLGIWKTDILRPPATVLVPVGSGAVDELSKTTCGADDPKRGLEAPERAGDTPKEFSGLRVPGPATTPVGMGTERVWGIGTKLGPGACPPTRGTSCKEKANHNMSIHARFGGKSQNHLF
jgi:hypothetical protein